MRSPAKSLEHARVAEGQHKALRLHNWVWQGQRSIASQLQQTNGLHHLSRWLNTSWPAISSSTEKTWQDVHLAHLDLRNALCELEEATASSELLGAVQNAGKLLRRYQRDARGLPDHVPAVTVDCAQMYEDASADTEARWQGAINNLAGAHTVVLVLVLVLLQTLCYHDGATMACKLILACA